MSKKLRILIVGATSSIAEHCARIWIKHNDCELILLGRDQEKLQRVENDLKVRKPNIAIQLHALDFLDSSAIKQCIELIYQSGVIDIALIAHGSLPDQERCQNDIDQCRQAIELNAISPVLFTEAITRYMVEKNHGNIAVIGSVAGDRGRKSNYVYGASKALIDKYVQGVQHRLALMGSNVVATLIKPGPTATPMTAGLDGKGKLASPDDVAQNIVDGIRRNKATIYTPGKWAIMMFIIRNLPFFLFKKMDI